MKKVLVGQKPYVIPARPDVLIQISQLLSAPEPDLEKVVSVLRKDVSLYAAVLAIANSALYRGSLPVTSLNQAVMRLGLAKLHALVKLASLKNTLSKAGQIDRFWDTASEIAELTARFAALLSKEQTDAAYSLGMMHDCGIPMMMEAFPDYREFLRRINGDNLPVIRCLEMEWYGYDHFTIGAEIAAAWHMPRAVCEAIRLQPHVDAALRGNIQCSEAGKLLLCYLLLAKDISETYRQYWRVCSPKSQPQDLKLVLEYVGIPDIDYLDLREDCLAELELTRE